MLKKIRIRPDMLLLFSLLLVILGYPALDHADFRRLILGGLLFVPVIMATVRLAEIRRRIWPPALLMSLVLVVDVVSEISPGRIIVGMKWGLLAIFFGFTVAGLFSFLRNAQSVSDSHLYTAVSIYLLLGLQWFALYSAIDVFYPGSILHNNATVTDRSSELLYFSLVTLSTIGYGDIVPLHGEVRMLAALEGVAGVLYLAITVALLVSAYRRQESPR